MVELDRSLGSLDAVGREDVIIRSTEGGNDTRGPLGAYHPSGIIARGNIARSTGNGSRWDGSSESRNETLRKGKASR